MKNWIIYAVIAVVVLLGLGCGTGALKCTPAGQPETNVNP